MSKQVTFLMPVYNGMPYLREAVESVLAQPGDDWELLAVDDLSSDGSLEFLQSLHDSRVRVERNEFNLGLYGTLDVWVHKVRSLWTALLFQDDLLHARYLNEFTSLVNRHPGIALFWAGVRTISGSGELLSQGVDSGREEVILPGQASWRSVMLRGTIWTIPGSWSQTAVLQRLGFRADLPHLGDYEFLLRALWQERLVYYQKPLTDLREHEKQASTANLASFRDLRERAQVIREQMVVHAGDVDVVFRCRVLWGLMRCVALRALGRLRRGEWANGLSCLRLLPSMLRAAMGTKSAKDKVHTSDTVPHC